MRRASRPARADLIGAALATVVPVAIAVVVLELWASPDLRVSLAVRGDAPPLLAMIKDLNASGWYFTNPDLGAPFGQELYDFPVYAGDTLHFLVIKAMSLFADQPGLILNAFVLLSYAWCGLAAYVAMRALDVSPAAAVVPAALFAVLPFHFLRDAAGHSLLASYVAVPIGVYLCLAVLTGRPLVGPRRRTLVTLALCVLIGTTGLYFAALTLMLLALATAFAAWRRPAVRTTLAGGGTALATIVVVLALGLAPTALHRLEHGANEKVANRGVADTEYYGLTLAQLVLPPDYHRVGALAGPHDRYTAAPVVAGEGTSWPGTLALAGLVLLTLAALSRLAGDRPRGLLADERLSASALLAGAAFVLGTAGGGSAIVAALFTTQLRGWNRISVVLAFLGLLAVAVAIDRLRGRVRGAALAGGLAVLLVLGALDQTSPEFRPPYERAQAKWAADGRFVQAVEERLGGEGDVVQLPYLRFPESPRLLRMRDYDPLAGYLHADAGLRWSYGAMKNRPTDWQAALAGKPLEEQVRGAAAAGFEGLWVDGFGFADTPVTLATLTKLTGSPPITSDGGRFSFFDLRPFATALRGELGAERFRALGRATLHPPWPR